MELNLIELNQIEVSEIFSLLGMLVNYYSLLRVSHSNLANVTNVYLTNSIEKQKF